MELQRGAGMGYVLGIDLGTTYSAAAVAEDGRAEIVQLGTRQAAIPSIVLLRADGEVLVGEAAERRAMGEPDRVAREFKRRLGDPTPLILGGTPYGAETLMAHLLRWIVNTVTELKGDKPDLVAITHPANYGAYKLDLLQQAARQADVTPVLFVSEPEAAAVHYTEQERVPIDSAVAVYDFGGGTFDAAVVRHREDGWELLGDGDGLERLGGIDFDEAVLAHVRNSLEGKLDELSVDAPGVGLALARLRADCMQAKETLSEDTEATVSVFLPNVQRDVRLTRAELESIIRPRVRETVQALERAVKSAGLTMSEVERILLVGGSSRIPLVSEIVREATQRPVAMDAQPKHAIALGAALLALRSATNAESAASSVASPATRASVQVSASAPASTAAQAENAQPKVPSKSGDGATPPPPSSEGAASGGDSRRPVLLAVAAAIVAVAVLGAVAVLALSGGGDGDVSGQAEATTETPTPTGALSVTATPSTSTPARTATATQIAASATQGPTATSTPTATVPTATTAPPQSAEITNISVVNGTYYVDFTVRGFTANIASLHVHFFFDIVSPENAGVPGSGPWYLYDTPSPFTGYTENDRPFGAEEMCILVANADHSVRQGTGNCVLLP